VTIGAAVIFMLTSLGLALLSKERTFSSTVIDLNKKETTAPAPILPQGSPDASKSDPSKPDASKLPGTGDQTPAPATTH
jgi:preprotein translocase subunit SecG